MISDRETNKTVTIHDASKKYLEFYAKALLEALLPDKYHGIRLWEGPDLLVNENFGIEVTWAMFDNQGRANGILNYVQGKKEDELNDGIRRNMENSGVDFLQDDEGKIDGYNLGSNRNYVSTDEIYRAYLKKNNKRMLYPQKMVGLFIYPPLAQMDGWLGETLIRMSLEEICRSEECPFDNVFIYEEPTLYQMSKTGVYRKTRGDSKAIHQCKVAADTYSGWSSRNL